MVKVFQCSIGSRYQLATKCEGLILFANTYTQTHSEFFSNSMIGMCEISLWTSNITPPPRRFLSFLYTLYGKASGNNSEVVLARLPWLVFEGLARYYQIV